MSMTISASPKLAVEEGMHVLGLDLRDQEEELSGLISV
jgi:hypothetical protein